MSGTLLLAGAIALRGATLIDGTGGPPLRNSLLVLADGRIASVGEATPEALRALPRDVQVRDVAGKWILPGLIDAHVHADSEAELAEMLRWGVTSVRRMGEDVEAAEKLARASRERLDIPDVFSAAPIFTAPGGWWADAPPDPHVNRFPATPEEARAAVRRAKDIGGREIKLMLDDMAWCRAPKPALPRMRREVASALLGEALRLEIPAIVHAPNLADAREAVVVGASALAHGVLEPIDADTLAVMAARPVFYVPTMGVFEFLADPRGFLDSVLADPAVTAPGAGLDSATLARLRSRAYSDEYRSRYPNFANVRRRLPVLRANLTRLHTARVPVALGTDMWAFPGLSVSVEIDLYVQAGLAPLQAIRAATQTAARSLRADADRGTLEPGKRADLLILSSDPLADARNLRRILEVWKTGRPVRRAAGQPPRR